MDQGLRVRLIDLIRRQAHQLSRSDGFARVVQSANLCWFDTSMVLMLGVPSQTTARFVCERFRAWADMSPAQRRAFDVALCMIVALQNGGRGGVPVHDWMLREALLAVPEIADTEPGRLLANHMQGDAMDGVQILGDLFQQVSLTTGARSSMRRFSSLLVDATSDLSIVIGDAGCRDVRSGWTMNLRLDKDRYMDVLQSAPQHSPAYVTSKFRDDDCNMGFFNLESVSVEGYVPQDRSITVSLRETLEEKLRFGTVSAYPYQSRTLQAYISPGASIYVGRRVLAEVEAEVEAEPETRAWSSDEPLLRAVALLKQRCVPLASNPAVAEIFLPCFFSARTWTPPDALDDPGTPFSAGLDMIDAAAVGDDRGWNAVRKWSGAADGAMCTPNTMRMLRQDPLAACTMAYAWLRVLHELMSASADAGRGSCVAAARSLWHEPSVCSMRAFLKLRVEQLMQASSWLSQELCETQDSAEASSSEPSESLDASPAPGPDSGTVKAWVPFWEVPSDQVDGSSSFVVPADHYTLAFENASAAIFWYHDARLGEVRLAGRKRAARQAAREDSFGMHGAFRPYPVVIDEQFGIVSVADSFTDLLAAARVCEFPVSVMCFENPVVDGPCSGTEQVLWVAWTAAIQSAAAAALHSETLRTAARIKEVVRRLSLSCAGSESAAQRRELRARYLMAHTIQTCLCRPSYDDGPRHTFEASYMITTALGTCLRTPGRAEVGLGEVVLLQRTRNPLQSTSMAMRSDMDGDGCITFGPGVFSQDDSARMMLVGATIPSVTRGSWAGHWRTWLRCEGRTWVEIDSMMGNRTIDFDERCLGMLEQQATVYMFKRVGAAGVATDHPDAGAGAATATAAAAATGTSADDAIIEAALRMLSLGAGLVARAGGVAGANAAAGQDGPQQAGRGPLDRAPGAHQQVQVARGRKRHDK